MATYPKEVFKMPRAIDSAIRNAIINAYEEGRDYCQVAESFGVKKKTAYSFVSKYERTGQLTSGSSTRR